MDLETLLFEIRDGVARVTLHRPDAANSLDLTMARELASVALRCDEDRAVRAVLLTGSGRIFCAGGDLRHFAAAGESVPTLIREMTASLHVALSRFARMRAPLVCAVAGTAAGAGLSLAASADLLLAGESAKFTMAYTRAGLVPDGSSTWTLPRLVGSGRALDLILTNRTLSAREAESWGLVTRVVADEALAEEADSLARRLAAGPTGAFAAAKRLVRGSLEQGLESQMELEARAIADAARGADGREGIAAFLEKRDPVFHGD